MMNFNFEKLPESFFSIYANKIYKECINENILYDKNTINKIMNILIKEEEYEKCENLKNFIKNNKLVYA